MSGGAVQSPPPSAPLRRAPPAFVLFDGTHSYCVFLLKYSVGAVAIYGEYSSLQQQCCAHCILLHCFSVAFVVVACCLVVSRQFFFSSSRCNFVFAASVSVRTIFAVAFVRNTFYFFHRIRFVSGVSCLAITTSRGRRAGEDEVHGGASDGLPGQALPSRGGPPQAALSG